MSDDPTPAGRVLEDVGVAYATCDVTGVTTVEEAAERHGIPTDHLIRTIVLRRGEDDYVFALVPGGRNIAWPKLRAHLGVNRVSLPDADEAKAATGFERGAITPFGATTAWPVVADASIPGMGTIGMGSGRRGTSLRVDADAMLAACGADVADIT